MVRIKVCGIRDTRGAKSCAANNVDFVGFNFVTGRRRSVTPEQARLLRPACGSAKSVGVFLNQDTEKIFRVLDTVPLDYVQLHGTESVRFCQEISHRTPVIKAMSINSDFEPSALQAYRPYVTFWLFDAPTAGEGKPFDWNLLPNSDLQLPYFLAGGLNPDNVAHAISSFSPYAVDTASGVEVEGKQCSTRINAFCRAVRGPNATNG
jgi:phosphoribosylanthranilate isomerase